MRIIAEGTCTISGTTRVIPNGTGAGQLPTGTKVLALYVCPNTGTHTIKVGKTTPKHRLETTDLRGFLLQHSGPSEDYNATGTDAETFDWTAYGND